MFRLKRIIGSRNNAPEFEEHIWNKMELPLIAGCAVKIYGGDYLTPATDYPEYMLVKTETITSPGRVKCFKVTPEMIFLVEYLGESAPVIGKRVSIETNENLPDSVIDNEEGPGKIVGLTDDPIYVYVQFDRKV